ncbi:MAG: acylneuraminate cytidylyltransferase family protein [Rhodospirillales bacterium]|nr:acylneuraminate cytidylyltransferase family protein [Rhodospirillales bacterium]
MIGAKRFVGIITARGGSKGVPRKNVRPFAGRPLLAYTADQARAVPEIDLAVLTTDDPEIKRLGRSLGLRVVDRPAELATDMARSEPAILHAIDALEREGERPFDYMVLLQPTSPLRTPATIRACMQRIADTGAESLVTVTEIREILGPLENGFLRPVNPGNRGPRQKRTPYYAANGCVFACSVPFLRRTGELMARDWLAYPVEGDDAVDIDMMEDFEYAEFLAARRRS